MHVSSTSTAKMHEWNIGVFAEGSASIDTSGLVTSDKGTVGVLAGQQGTVNIESLGMWQTKELNVGQSGIGYVYVRDRGTLKVDGAAILGHNAHSRGVLNLIGAESKLQLGATGSLTIGDQGAGGFCAYLRGPVSRRPVTSRWAGSRKVPALSPWRAPTQNGQSAANSPSATKATASWKSPTGARRPPAAPR